MTNEFPVAQLREVIDRVVGGGTPSRSVPQFWGGDIPWATVKDFTDETLKIDNAQEHITVLGLQNSAANVVPEGTVILCTRIAVGRAALATSAIAINQDLKALFPSTGMRPAYLLRQLQHKRPKLDGIAIGTTVKGITLEALLNLTVEIPEVSEQALIAAILDTVDDAIRYTEQMIAKLKQVRAGLLHDLLTYGIDENGELRDPVRHPEQFQNTKLGLLPKHWLVSTTGIEFDITSGLSLGPFRRPANNPKPYLRVANVHRDLITVDDIAQLEASESEMADRTLDLNDLLVVEGHADVNEIGRCARVTSEIASMSLTFQNHLFRLRAFRVNAEYALLWLNSNYARSHWRRRCGTSSGLNTINQTILKELLFAIPSVDEQQNISGIVDIYRTDISSEESFLHKLRVIKHGLMDDLLTGRVRVVDLLSAEE